MMSSALRLAALLCLLAAPGAGEVAPAMPPVAAVELAALRPEEEAERRCTPDGALCIAKATYDQDICRVIEEAAQAEALDPGFFARLLWRESLFDASAVSHAGAQGIAQFMPATAARRRLSDPFNPAEAILASADYLKDLERQFGNLGLAAAAYNAGEERVSRYLAGASGLPGETRAYVVAITGHPAENWRDGPLPSPDFALDPDKPFREACLAKAQSRNMPSFPSFVPKLSPWGVILAAHRTQEAAEQQARGLAGSLGALVAGERIDYHHGRVPGMPQQRHMAQIGRESRAEAEELCGRIRAAGASCIVLRN